MDRDLRAVLVRWHRDVADGAAKDRAQDPRRAYGRLDALTAFRARLAGRGGECAELAIELEQHVATSSGEARAIVASALADVSSSPPAEAP